MKYFETNYFNREEKEIRIAPKNEPVLISFKNGHYGYEKTVLFPGDVARLNVSGLENGHNFFSWKKKENCYSSFCSHKVFIALKDRKFYIFETGLHQDYVDDAKLRKVIEIKSNDYVREFYEAYKHYHEQILKLVVDRELTLETLSTNTGMLNLPIKQKRLEPEIQYWKRTKEYILSVLK